MEECIRVLIVEDDPDWRRGLASYLEQEKDLTLVAPAADVAAALQAIERGGIDVVLMDIMLANSMEGIMLTSEVCQRSQAKVIMLTSLAEEDVIFDAFQAGATDYLLKSGFAGIPAAIRAVHQNRAPISASVAEQMRQEFRRLKRLEQEYRAKELRELITPAELQVLEMIDNGYTQTQIAAKFVISIRTVKVHVGHILRKLGGRSSKEAAQKARDMGFFK